MFQCKDLLSLTSLATAKVVSGHSGLKNGIRWVYKPESMHFSKWVRGRELMIVSTPVIQSEDFDLFRLIKEAVKLNMSGALLLVGNSYITKISKEVMAFTDKNKFPLFIISGEKLLIDIFEEIGYAIAYSDNPDEDSEDVLASIIFGQSINVDTIVMKSNIIGYDITPPQQIFVLNITSSNNIELFDRSIIENKIKNCFSDYNIELLLSHYGNNYVGMFHNFNDSKKVMSNIYMKLKDIIGEEYKNVSIKIGIGRSVERLEFLQESFKEASECLINASKINKADGIYYYDDFLFYHLISEIDNPKAVREFVDKTIGDIIAYDKENNTELLKTLKNYINANCSLIHSAELLHTHKNTVKYRINRIEEITGKNLSECSNRLEFMNAILFREMGIF